MSSTELEFKREQKYVIERIAELREEVEDLRDYLDLLRARAQNLGKERYSTEQIKKMLQHKQRGYCEAPIDK